MNIKIDSLVLFCKESTEHIDLSSHISIFHGQINSGKSTIVRLVDYCLGGDLERTPAITSQLLSVELNIRIGEFNCVFEREAEKSDQVQVTWQDATGKGRSILAPNQPVNNQPILDDDIFNLSDLIFHFLGVIPPKVRKNKIREDSPMVRLSFRDMMWYCYLEQSKLDSSFYELDVDYKKQKSRDIMRFISGYYTENLLELENKLSDTRIERNGKIEAVKQIESFLENNGFETETEIKKSIEDCTKELQEAQVHQAGGREFAGSKPHIADQLQNQLRELNAKIKTDQENLIDVGNKIRELESLNAELITTKMKLYRAEIASPVLGGVKFQICPMCGEVLIKSSENTCHLCKQLPTSGSHKISLNEVATNKDLNSRIGEIDEALDRYKKAESAQIKSLDQLIQTKNEIDSRLDTILKDYDSRVLSNIRDIDRTINTLEEKIRGLNRLLLVPNSIQDLYKEADILLSDEEKIKRDIEVEKTQLGKAENNVKMIESTYLESLLKVGVPGTYEDDIVKIDRRTWIPHILAHGDESAGWTFFNIGSGGKKVLLNALYALAIHKVAAECGLPLPSLLIIDTPMKNIGEEHNENLFKGFYNYLYDLAANSLSHTQLIIVDNEFFPPDNEVLDISTRYMTPNDDKYPPLITYYRGS
jgi:tetratricopeptide (TPR) repeat protein